MKYLFLTLTAVSVFSAVTINDDGLESVLYAVTVVALVMFWCTSYEQ